MKKVASILLSAVIVLLCAYRIYHSTYAFIAIQQMSVPSVQNGIMTVAVDQTSFTRILMFILIFEVAGCALLLVSMLPIPFRKVLWCIGMIIIALTCIIRVVLLFQRHAPYMEIIITDIVTIAASCINQFLHTRKA